jgi:hypothetical protein
MLAGLEATPASISRAPGSSARSTGRRMHGNQRIPMAWSVETRSPASCCTFGRCCAPDRDRTSRRHHRRRPLCWSSPASPLTPASEATPSG